MCYDDGCNWFCVMQKPAGSVARLVLAAKRYIQFVCTKFQADDEPLTAIEGNCKLICKLFQNSELGNNIHTQDLRNQPCKENGFKLTLCTLPAACETVNVELLYKIRYWCVILRVEIYKRNCSSLMDMHIISTTKMNSSCSMLQCYLDAFLAIV